MQALQTLGSVKARSSRQYAYRGIRNRKFDRCTLRGGAGIIHAGLPFKLPGKPKASWRRGVQSTGVGMHWMLHQPLNLTAGHGRPDVVCPGLSEPQRFKRGLKPLMRVTSADCIASSRQAWRLDVVRVAVLGCIGCSINRRCGQNVKLYICISSYSKAPPGRL